MSDNKGENNIETTEIEQRENSRKKTSKTKTKKSTKKKTSKNISYITYSSSSFNSRICSIYIKS